MAIGLGFASPALLCVAATPVGKSKPTAAVRASALEEIAESADAIDSWRDYALSSLKTNFSWASDPGDIVEPPSIFNRGRSSFARAPTMHFPGTSVEDASPFHVALQSTRVADTPFYVSAEQSNLLPDYSPGLRRTVIAPSLTQRVGDSSSVRFSAIFAYQRLAGFGMSATDVPPSAQDFPSANEIAPPPLAHGNDSGFGVGGRVDFNNTVTHWLSWTAGYQSRVSMDGFSSYRGIFGQPGSFDIPPSANVGMGVALTPTLRLNLGVDRVMYAQTTPFASYSLPPLMQVYLKLFGQYSPRLNWENLNIYSVGMNWHNSTLGDFGVRYSTQQQPNPSSVLLQQIIAPNISAHDWEFDYARAIGENSIFRLSAMYAPIQLLGNPVTYSLSNANGASQMRVEALWTYQF